jgi:putative N6-adenine-specific DNA methylase
MVLGVAPQLRRWYGLHQLRTFDAAAWQAACDRQERMLAVADGTAPPGIFGGDIDKDIIEVATRNAARAGIRSQPGGNATIQFRAGNFADSPPPCEAPGWIVSNLPYGERMSFGGRGDVLGTIGRHLRQHYTGWTVCLLTSDLQLPGKLGLKPRRKIPLYNGTLDCRLFIFDIR